MEQRVTQYFSQYFFVFRCRFIFCRFSDNALYNPQDDEKYSTITEGVNLWNPQRQYPGIWGVGTERDRLVQKREQSNVNKTNFYSSTPFNYQGKVVTTFCFFLLSVSQCCSLVE